MSSLADYVSLQITQDSTGIARAGFGVPLILSALATFPERVRTYTQLSDMIDDGFVSGSPEYIAASAMFSQDEHPESIMVGRSALPPTLVYTIGVQEVSASRAYTIDVTGPSITATAVTFTSGAVNQAITSVTFGTDLFTKVAHGLTTGTACRLTTSAADLPQPFTIDTDYYVIRIDADTFKLATTAALAAIPTPIDIIDNGTGTHTINTYTNDLIVSQLVNGLNAVVGNTYIAAIVAGAGETDTLTVTADAAGGWFSLEMDSIAALNTKMTHVDPGVATDLAAITLEQPGWYCLHTMYNSSAYVLAAALWIEANSRFYNADTADSKACTVAAGAGTDVIDQLHTLDYARTAAWYHPRPSAMLAAGLDGAVLPKDAGSETWKFVNVSGVEAVVLTATHRTNLRAKEGNSYESVAGLAISFEGTTADGGYIDTRRGLDWLEDDMKSSVFEVLASGTKTPFTDKGIAKVQAAMKASLKRAVAQGVLAADPAPTVTVPLVSSVSTANKAARVLPDMKFTGTLDGAVHRVEVRGVVSV